MQNDEQLTLNNSQTESLTDVQLKAIFEGILFAAAAPVAVEQLSKITAITPAEANRILFALTDEYADAGRGMILAEREGGWQLVTNPLIAEYVARYLQPVEKATLSKAALETLAIIAYKQPVTRSEIEAVRGVKCDKALATLLSKNLIIELGKLETLGKPVIFGTTDRFLSFFGLSSLDDLPEVEEVLIDLANNEKNAEITAGY